MTYLKKIGLKIKQSKLVNGLKWLTESDANNENITKMTNELKEVNDEINKLEDTKSRD